MMNIDKLRFLKSFVVSALLICAPSFAFASNCVSGIVGTTGAGSCTVPSGVTSMTFKAWGGGSGADASHGGSGGGAGACSIAVTVSPGGTVYYNVAAYDFAGSGGGTSWINNLANSQPSSSSNGCYATGGQPNAGSGGSGGPAGVTGYAGGGGFYNGFADVGGGGGAGSGGSGGTGGAFAGGTGGTPDGGAGGYGAAGGSIPGGGGGYSSGTGYAGASGQISLVFTAPPATSTFFFKPFP